MQLGADQGERAMGVLATLRRLVPDRALTHAEARRLAELQARRLHELCGVDDAPVHSRIVAELPRVRVVHERGLPVSGTSHWSGTTWIIALNADESWQRQRFTLMHEFKHVLDHGRADQLYAGDGWRSANEQAESVADYFAGCALMPRRLLKRAWSGGLQTPARLAWHFQVSARAAEVRLLQVGLSQPRHRCRGPGRYFRQMPLPLRSAA